MTSFFCIYTHFHTEVGYLVAQIDKSSFLFCIFVVSSLKLHSHEKAKFINSIHLYFNRKLYDR